MLKVRSFNTGKIAPMVVSGIALLFSGAVLASTDHVTGTGSWDASAPVTDISTPGASWVLSFDIPSTLSSNPTTQAYNFSYSLNGVVVPLTLAGLQFYDTSKSGLFDAFFDNTISVLSVYGADVGSTNVITTGVFPATIAVDGGDDHGSGVITISSVPEPASWLMLMAGTALIALRSNRASKSTGRDREA